MLLIRALLLWAVVSVHVVGAAVLFRRFFPRESPWFGFVLPGLALVVTLNFIEHLVALPTLLGLLPFTLVGAVWALVQPGTDWKGLRLPTGIFLGSFAFTLTLRALLPDILTVRDGISDFCIMASFCMGEKVPPPFLFYPPLHLAQYYTLGHYALSVVTRLFGLDPGTGYNLGAALLGAFDCFIVAAAAWRIARHKVWIALLAPVVFICAANGATAFFWLTSKVADPTAAEDLLKLFENPTPEHEQLRSWLHFVDWPADRELVAPGSWSWLGTVHSTSAELMLVLLSVWALAEILRRKATNLSWICAATLPFLSIVTSTWALPLEVALLAGGAFCVWRGRFAPRDVRFVLIGIAGVYAALMPAVLDFLTRRELPVHGWTSPEDRTQLFEFLLLWWPIYLPWLALLFTWRRQEPIVRTVLAFLPPAFLGVEFYTIAGRNDWTNKLWGFLFAIGWIVLFPALCLRRGLLFRGLLGLLLISSAISLVSWIQYTASRVRLNPGLALHLEGNQIYRADPQREPILAALSEMKGKTVLTGKSLWMYVDSPALAAFTGNRLYISWSYFADGLAGGHTSGFPQERENEINDLYDGKCADPLLYLVSHEIFAMVIYPPDNIGDDVLARLKKQLGPWYEYRDFRRAGPNNSGIFIRRPGVPLGPWAQAGGG